MTNREDGMIEITNMPNFWQQVRDAKTRFLGLDYDGTLAPFAIDPMHATPFPGIASLLQQIIAGGQTQVAIISGRPVAEVLTLLDNPPVVVVGSHGYELWPVDGACVVRQPTPSQQRGLTSVQAHLLNKGYDCTLESKIASIAIHTRGLEPEKALAIEEAIVGDWGERVSSFGLECRRFNGGIEIRCSGWDKGGALTELLNVQPPNVFAVYVGDDETDEDAFSVLRGRGIGIKVGDPSWPTAAQGRLADCQSVAAFLQAWARATEPGGSVQ